MESEEYTYAAGPLAEDDYSEYRDGEFVSVLQVPLLSVELMHPHCRSGLDAVATMVLLVCQPILELTTPTQKLVHIYEAGQNPHFANP